MGIVRKYLSFGVGLNFWGIVNGGNFDCHLGNEGGWGEGKGYFHFPSPPSHPVQTLVN